MHLSVPALVRTLFFQSNQIPEKSRRNEQTGYLNEIPQTS